ncbi:hypothetical protein R69888_04158 [Paraburkholderia haematera]|uniref:Uncharacterized protein n=1 Tax=Paraburkholderia haematera TaxID=2793077 RepID=A0ABM8RY57_9BURK|nr:hypothetical protein R69888_04158 [Paraburkholderia haematera]
MSNSEKAEDLRIVERNPGYDKANNPQRLSIAELMPVARADVELGLHSTRHSQSGWREWKTAWRR